MEWIKLKNVAKYPTGKLNSNAACEDGIYPFFTCSHEIYKINCFAYDGEYVLLGGNNATGDFPVFYYNGKFEAYQRTYLIQPLDVKQFSTRFLFYAIGEKLNLMQKNASGTATKFLTKPILDNITIPNYDFLTQQKIASILSTYDTLIENNNKRIKILEQMAENLYKEWFVRFRFPGRENTPMENGLPKGWKNENLFDVANVSYGYSFKSDLFCDDSSLNAVVRIRDIQDNRTDTFTSEICDSKYLIEENSILVGMDGIFHMCLWNGDRAYLNQRVVKLNSKIDSICNYLLYFNIRPQVKFWEQVIAGTTVAHLGDKHLKKMKVLIPSAVIVEKANCFFKDIMLERNKLIKQNQSLTRQRDLLLPRLMSGKLEVNT